MTGRYVAFEGVDGAGKSTVCHLVGAALEERGHATTIVREPGGTEVGEAIRTILLDRPGDLDHWAEALLFAAGRAQLAATVIGPALAAGRVVLSDRSVYSSLAYQGGGRGLGVDAVRAVNKAGLRDIWPDVVVVLRIAPESGLEREHGADRISSEGVELQRRVAETYDELAAADPDRFVVTDARREVDVVVADVVAELVGRW